MTKDEASDLRSFIDRAIETTLKADQAEHQRLNAQSQLDSFVWKLQQNAKEN